MPDAPEQSRLRALEWAAPLLLTIFALILRLAALGEESLWADEFYTWRTATQPTLADVLHTVVTIEPHPPLYFYIMHLWIGIFGDSDVSLRFPSALAGALAIPLLYLAARRLWPARRTLAILAAFLFALSPMQITYSQEARSYAMQVLLATLAWAALAAALTPAPTSPRRRGLWLLGAALAGALALQLQYYSAFIAGAIGAVILAGLLFPRLGAPRRFAAAALLLLILGAAMPLYGAWWRATHHWGEDLPFMPERYGPDLLVHVARAQFIGPWFAPLPLSAEFALLAAGTLLFLLAGAALFRERRRAPAAPGILTAIFIFTLAAPVLISFMKPIVYWGQRYLVMATPVTAILLAIGAHSGRARPARFAARTLLCLVVAGQCVYLHSYYTHRQKHMWDRLADHFVEIAPAAAVPRVIPARAALILDRYLPPLRRSHGVDSISQLAAQVPPSADLWIVGYTDLRPDLLAAGYGPRIDLFLFETHRPGQQLFIFHAQAAAAPTPTPRP